MICAMMSASCASKTPPGLPEHCDTKDEWPRYEEAAREKAVIHKPDENGVPRRYRAYAARTAYLEGVCKGINEFRGEKLPE